MYENMNLKKCLRCQQTMCRYIYHIPLTSRQTLDNENYSQSPTFTVLLLSVSTNLLPLILNKTRKSDHVFLYNDSTW